MSQESTEREAVFLCSFDRTWQVMEGVGVHFSAVLVSTWTVWVWHTWVGSHLKCDSRKVCESHTEQKFWNTQWNHSVQCLFACKHTVDFQHEIPLKVRMMPVFLVSVLWIFFRIRPLFSKMPFSPQVNEWDHGGCIHFFCSVYDCRRCTL